MSPSLLRSLLRLGALTLTVVAGACDAEPESVERVSVDLSPHGIDGVSRDAEGHYTLLDSEGEPIGTVEHEDAEGRASVVVELADASAALSWSGDEALAVECRPAEAPEPSSDPIAGCSRELSIAAELVEAEGFDVPDHEASDVEFGFREACTYHSSWVLTASWGPYACDRCYQEAKKKQGPQGTHTSGSCDSGVVWTSCTHEFCHGGFQPEGPSES